MFRKKKLIGLLFVISGSVLVQAQSLSPFKNGDKIAFIGNSITEAGFYGSNIWLYYMTRFPEQRITILNTGIGGDVVGQMNDRFEHDVLSKKPNIVVLTFGMNDSGYFEFNQPDSDETARKRIESSLKNFGILQEKLQAQPEIKPVIMSSSPYDETMQNKNNYYKGKSKVMEKIVAFQQEVAKSRNWTFVDLFHPMTAINLMWQKTKADFTITGPDRIHPGRGGHLVMAALFLESQGLADRPIATVDLDAKSGAVLVQNAKVDVKEKAKTGMRFNYLAQALPFPIDSVSGVWENPQTQADALAVYPFIQKFNQETLRVKNLNKGNYDLLIDGRRIKTFSADTLSKGINMALLSNTPQYQQAVAIMYLNDLRLDVEKKLREYYWLHFNFFKKENMLFEDSQAAFEKVTEKAKSDWFVKSKMATYQTARFPEVRKMWEECIDQLTNRIYEINKPKPHLIEIVPTKYDEK